MRPLAGGGSCPPYFDPSPLRRYALLRYGGLSAMEPRVQYAQAEDGVSIEHCARKQPPRNNRRKTIPTERTG